MNAAGTFFQVLGLLGLAATSASGQSGARAAEAGAQGAVPQAVTVALAAQEEQLRTSLAETAAVIVSTPRTLEVWYPVRLAFVPDGTELRPTGTAMLDLVARSLHAFPRSQVVVAVYTDAIGGADANQRQSQARAAVLVDALQSRGVAASRLVARGMGESDQLEAPASPEGRDLNRRVLLVITPLSS